jgi:predicted nucleotidyltransferase
MKQKEVLQYLASNKQDISRRYHLTKLGIFGSYARNEQTAASDLDLLVDFEENTPDIYGIKLRMRSEMQEVFRMPIDICSEKWINPIFRKQILEDAIYV